MANISIPLVHTTQSIPSNLTDFKNKVPLIQWAPTDSTDVYSGNGFTMDEGSHVSWKRTATQEIKYPDNRNVFALNPARGGITLKTKQSGEKYFIAYTEMENSRHFRFNEMGWEHFQSSGSNHSMHLAYIAREYYRPSDNKTWRFGDAWNGEANKDTLGYFYTRRAFSPREEQFYNSGYFLKRIWYQFRTTGGVGGDLSSYVEVFNMRFGYGSGDASENHMICLPKMRALDEAYTPSFGD